MEVEKMKNTETLRIASINLILSEINNYIHFIDMKTKGIEGHEPLWKATRAAYASYVKDLKERWIEN